MTILEYYQRTYDSLIEKRRKFPLTKDKNDPNYVYCETHHIVPKCIGGTNEKENLVNLTAREHFIAHKLLLKIYEKSNDKNAYIRMGMALGRLITGNKEFINNISISSKEYERIKEIWVESTKAWMTIPENKEKMKYERTEEIRKILSMKQKLRFQNMTDKEKEKNRELLKNGHKNMSKENKDKMRKNQSLAQKKKFQNFSEEDWNKFKSQISYRERSRSKEERKRIDAKKRETLIKHNMIEKMRKFTQNLRWVKNPITHESKYIQKEEFDNYISNGWLPGFYKGKHKHPRNVTVFWICNDETKESKWWKKTEPIPDGWRKGRYIEIKNKRKTSPGNKELKWIHKDGVRKYINQSEIENYLSDGLQLSIGK